VSPLEDIARRRGALIATIGAQRGEIARGLAPLAPAIRLADGAWEGARFVRAHPYTFGALAALVAAIRPRRAFNLGRTAIAVWQAWRWLKRL
jgi:hypothetical protein